MLLMGLSERTDDLWARGFKEIQKYRTLWWENEQQMPVEGLLK
jgi:hypothetical protein